MLGLLVPPRAGSLPTQSRSGPRVPGRVVALLSPLRDRCDDTRDHRQRPDRSRSLADSGHIFFLGTYGRAVAYFLLTLAVSRPEPHGEIPTGGVVQGNTLPKQTCYGCSRGLISSLKMSSFRLSACCPSSGDGAANREDSSSKLRGRSRVY